MGEGACSNVEALGVGSSVGVGVGSCSLVEALGDCSSLDAVVVGFVVGSLLDVGLGGCATVEPVVLCSSTEEVVGVSGVVEVFGTGEGLASTFRRELIKIGSYKEGMVDAESRLNGIEEIDPLSIICALCSIGEQKAPLLS